MMRRMAILFVIRRHNNQPPHLCVMATPSSAAGVEECIIVFLFLLVFARFPSVTFIY